MKATTPNRQRTSSALLFLSTLLLILAFSACQKNNEPKGNSNQASAFTADVLDKWMTMQIRLMKNATGIPNHPFARHFAYAGIAAFEAVSPGIPASARWSGKWNGLSGLPATNHSLHYYYPANVNAAMASINRAYFFNASTTDKAAIDSLENALNLEFSSTQNASLLYASAQFGKEVATAIFNWAETDGYKNAGNTYTPPTGDGLWVATPSAFASAVTPYWGNIRTTIEGSTIDSQPGAPPAYSTAPGSSFYQMVKQVYDAAQTVTEDEKATAMFWKDVPGTSTPGHWLSILQQVIRLRGSTLDKAAQAYAFTGSALHDAIIACFQTKYFYNLVRPITYIRNVMGYSNWISLISTPAHPEYTSAHAVFSAAAAEVLQRLFGNSGMFTDHTYDYMGLAPRSFSSFAAIAEEAGRSRFYAGIHYLPSVEAGLVQGRKVADNILHWANWLEK